ncbi:MAG: YbaB/EbfC family nucleoid-associated protein [Marmoricola sp.]
MTQNPFESAFGGAAGAGGGFDLGAMLEQAQQMQAQLLAAQEELAAATVQGSAGGVTVTVNGTGEVVKVAFASGTEAGDDDALADLADLVVAAYRDAKVRSDALAQEKIGPLTGGIGGLPGGAGV